MSALVLLRVKERRCDHVMWSGDRTCWCCARLIFVTWESGTVLIARVLSPVWSCFVRHNSDTASNTHCY